MVSSSIVDAFPLWVLYIISLAIVLLSIEAGWQLGRYRRQSSGGERDAPVGAAVGSTLGLLAFLLAFTFGMAATRYDTRKQIVLQEANAIGTTYLRTDFLPLSGGDEARSLLREYAALRAGGANAIMGAEGVSKTADLHHRLWAIAAGSVVDSDSIATGLFIQSLNEMIDLDAVHLTALRNRIPDTIWLMLFVVTVSSMVALGYQFGLTGVRSWTTMILLALVFTFVILLIADLDRPQAGWLQVSQQPIIDLLNTIAEPAP